MSVVKFLEIKLADIIQIGNTAWSSVITPPPSLNEIQKEIDKEFNDRLDRWSEQQS